MDKHTQTHPVQMYKDTETDRPRNRQTEQCIKKQTAKQTNERTYANRETDK
jgi:hypothetical protein